MRLLLLFLFLIAGRQTAFSQEPTVGLFLNSENSWNGYTLFAPMSSKKTFLIDNCGRLINEWNSEYTPGMVSYLLPDGSLLRAGRIFGNFASGGAGGRIEIISWEDELLWSYNIANPQMHQHHDLEPMPNGNFLVIVWEKIPEEEAIEAGRDPASIGGTGTWYEKIMEIKPVGSNEIEIVWQWRLFDHLVQDRDSTKSNFGVISEHPELIDINYQTLSNNAPGNADWFHMNSVDYNPELDQIIFSSRALDEIYIIDHSTSGDILFRWGNPESYDKGDHGQHQLFGPHDARWIDSSAPDKGKIMVFNNGVSRPEGNYSSVETIDPPKVGNGYVLDSNGVFDPGEILSFKGHDQTNFFSIRVSGAQQLPNGNMLICSGNESRIFEVDREGFLVWDYINPVNQHGSIIQGNPPSNTQMFRAERYDTDYSAFEDKFLDPGDVLESNPLPGSCIIYDNPSSTEELQLTAINLYPNPANDLITIENASESRQRFMLYNSYGQMLYSFSLQINERKTIDVTAWPAGVYILRSEDHMNKLIISH